MENIMNLIDQAAAAEYLGVAPKTMAQWRFRGDGPKYVKLSPKCVRYRKSDLEDYTEQRTVAHTTEATVKLI
jgi:predicted DNA-binding transcriptional regulator AlpA